MYQIKDVLHHEKWLAVLEKVAYGHLAEVCAVRWVALPEGYLGRAYMNELGDRQIDLSETLTLAQFEPTFWHELAHHTCGHCETTLAPVQIASFHHLLEATMAPTQDAEKRQEQAMVNNRERKAIRKAAELQAKWRKKMGKGLLDLFIPTVGAPNTD